MATQTAPAARKSRDDFLQAAFSLMAEGRGVAAIRIEALCRQLDVSKGSFYWHFKNREGLIEALVEAWAGRFQRAIHLQLEEQAQGRPQAVIDALIAFWRDSELAQIDRAMRHWAYTDVRVQQAVAEADRLLLTFLTRQLSQLGYNAKEAHRKARLMMAVGIAEPEIAHLPKAGSDRREAAWMLKQVLGI